MMKLRTSPAACAAFTAVSLVAGLLATGASAGCERFEADNPSTKRSDGMTAQPGNPVPPEGKNRLCFEKSPYLLQHAANPVDWYPWGDEAFEKARAENKPVFLSIGYSTCHWCHVMEHESFEHPQVASLMNETFVCIKVDREERPDIDNVYMTVCQMMTGSGGWPLTVFLTPEREPFFAATYVPRDAMLNLMPRLKQAWENDRANLLQSTDQIISALRGITSGAPGAALDLDHIRTAAEQLGGRYDATWGGFGTAPKFPAPHNLTFLLRYWKRTGDEHALDMVETTLKQMRRGGMYDQVGFGFHRYSTDRSWFLPHFEKMLYDQALLVMAYTDAFQATGDPEYRRTAEEILTYVLRDMTHRDGGYYSAEDADSEGEEGKFYLWSETYLKELLGADADRVIEIFGVQPEGNWSDESSGRRPGTNILYLPKPLAEAASAYGLTEEQLMAWWDPLRTRLFNEREGRVHPYKDDKILTDWNGLMIAAMARAARVFNEPLYAESAKNAVRFVEQRLDNPSGGLYHRYRDGEASVFSMVDDYAFFTWGLLELYQTSFDTAYLRSAVEYTEFLLKYFWDEQNGGLFFAPDNGEKLIVRSKEVYDGAIPSGNSVAALNLIRLSRITAETRYEEKAVAIGRAFEQQVSRSPSAFTLLMSAADFLAGPSYEIVIAGKPDGEDTRRMITGLNKRYIPNKVVVFRPEPDGDGVADLAPYTKKQRTIDNAATAYVCRNYACELPTTDVSRMLELLGEK